MSNRVCSVFVKLIVVPMLVIIVGPAGCGGNSSGTDSITGGTTSSTGGTASYAGVTGTTGGGTGGTAGTAIPTGGLTSAVSCGSTEQDGGANDAVTPSFEFVATDAFCDPNALFLAIEGEPFGQCLFTPIMGLRPTRVIEVVLDGAGQVISTTNLDSSVLPSERWPCLAGQTITFYCYFME